MKLVIAEKPSVARDIATVLGAVQKKNGYLEGNGYRVTVHRTSGAAGSARKLMQKNCGAGNLIHCPLSQNNFNIRLFLLHKNNLSLCSS